MLLGSVSTLQVTTSVRLEWQFILDLAILQVVSVVIVVSFASSQLLCANLEDHLTAMASNFYRAQDAPQYILGHSLELAFVVVGMVATVLLRLAYQRINRQRDLLDPSEYPDDPDSLGDRSPLFRYML